MATRKTTEIKKPAKTAKKKPAPEKEPEVIELPTMTSFPSLRKGTKETGYVTLLQTILKSRGYYDGPVDGRYGDNTAKAVMAFQKDCKKPMNGSVGPKTWELLQNSKVTAIRPQPVVQMPAQQTSSGVSLVIEGLTRYQADLLIKLLQGHTECRIL